MSLSPERTYLELSGFVIAEPATALTDFIVTAVCFVALYRMRKLKWLSTSRYFKGFFWCMGIASLIGGLFGHALISYFSHSAKIPSWVLSSLAVFFIATVSIIRAKPLISEKMYKMLLYLNGIQTVVLVCLSVTSQRFLFSLINTAIGFLCFVLILEIYMKTKTKQISSQYMIFTVLVLLIAAILIIMKFSLSKWFNYYDIGHILMAISCYLIYKTYEVSTKLS